MVISWKPPLDSGGVDVSNYIIEKRDTNRDMWTTVTSATTKTTCKVCPKGLSTKIQSAIIRNSECLSQYKTCFWTSEMLTCSLFLFFSQIPKLTEGREYIMRISAENMYGISDPLESEEMRAKDLFSMFCSNPVNTCFSSPRNYFRK